MNTHSNIKLSSLHAQVSTTLRDATFRVCAVLELMKSAQASRLREQLHERLNAAHQTIEEGFAINARVKQTVHARNVTDATFIKGLRGFVALVQVADPALARTLPSTDNLSRLDPDGYAKVLAGALRQGGKQANACAELIESATENRLEAAQAALQAKTSRQQLSKSRRAAKSVKALLHTAEAYVHESVESDSPLLPMLKAPRKARKPKVAPEPGPGPAAVEAPPAGAANEAPPTAA